MPEVIIFQIYYTIFFIFTQPFSQKRKGAADAAPFRQNIVFRFPPHRVTAIVVRQANLPSSSYADLCTIQTNNHNCDDLP